AELHHQDAVSISLSKERTMFRDTLLESAPVGRRRKRWPMALAFTFELLVGAALVALPLISTGVIPVSARTPLIAPRLVPVPVKPVEAAHRSSGPVPDGGGRPTSTSVIPLAFGPNRIKPGTPTQESASYDAFNPNPGGSSIGLALCACITPEIPK